MSIRPLDVVMSVTQSQNIKPPDALHTIKDVQHAQHMLEQHIKVKESVPTISEDGHTSDTMSELKQGMNNGDQHDMHRNQQECEQSVDFPHKELLDEDHGNNIDLTC